jgi:hypothetical protein
MIQMNTNSKTSRGRLLALTILLFFSVAPATASAQSADKLPIQTPLQKELAKFDKNKDGKIDAEERAAYLAAEANKRQDYIKKWDKNGDGKLDEQERSAARAAAKQAFAEAKRSQAIDKVKAAGTGAATSKAPQPTAATAQAQSAPPN